MRQIKQSNVYSDKVEYGIAYPYCAIKSTINKAVPVYTFGKLLYFI